MAAPRLFISLRALALRVPRRTLLRFLLLPALLVGFFVVLRWTPLGGYLSSQRLADTVSQLRQAWWAPLVLIGSYLVLSPLGIPATPLMVAGGVVFGTIAGSIYNVIGVFLGASATYLLGRMLGRDFVVHLAGKRLKRVERVIARRGFWGLVGVRFLPLPFPLVNYCAALAGIRPLLFLATTALGITPTVTIYTYFFAVLSHAPATARSEIYLQLAIAIALLLLLTLVPQLWAVRQRRQRYGELCARRLGRSRGARPAFGRPAAAPPRPREDR
ncbi:MAG: VTT domain-containing protein [Acidobacteriota bacterium]|nr:VTT domain-containing protein [Acidobacteriota bacterium]